jgi:hypothetical protein
VQFLKEADIVHAAILAEVFVNDQTNSHPRMPTVSATNGLSG